MNPPANPAPTLLTVATRRNLLVLLLMGSLLVLAAYLRFADINGSLVDAPYRADAAEYYNYAYNLRHLGVYSDGAPDFTGAKTAPLPDAVRTPGYALFLTPFADGPPFRTTIRHIAYAQAVMGVLTVLLVFLIFVQFATPWAAIVAAAFTALSPHLVNTSIYMLSETLFSLLIALTVFALCIAFRNDRRFLWALLLAGLLAGLASLTRPVLEYFVPCVLALLLFSLPRVRALKGGALLLLGFLLVWTPWVARNYVTLGASGDNLQMRATLHQGMYADLMYRDDPRSYGYPYNSDPDYVNDNATLGTVLSAIGREFQRQPLRETYWYLIGKPVHLWSWDMEAGTGDIYIYPTMISPYASAAPLFMVSHVLMRGLQWPLLALALAGCLYIFLPAAGRRFDGPALLGLRSVSLLLLYNTGILMLGAPFARYSIPFLPFAYGIALAFLPVAWDYLAALRQRSLVAHRAGR